VLADLAPKSGHMTHMPGHIFYRTGDYMRAQVSFDLSTQVDEAYMHDQKVAADDDWNYVHNVMYSIANLLEEGRMVQAAKVSAKLKEARGERAATLYPWSLRDSMTRIDPLLPIALRSGNWPEVEQETSQARPDEKFPHLQLLATSLTDFARGMQAVNVKNLDEARRQSAQLDAELWRLSQQMDDEKTASKAKPADNTATARPKNQAQPTDAAETTLLKSLAILSLELRGAILIADSKIPEAEALFNKARHDEVELGYREPPAFIQPVAEQEAELLFATGKDALAEKAWQQALEDRPNSGFPLYGLAEVAERSGDAAKASAAYNKFLTAWKTADLTWPQLRHAGQWLASHPDRSLALDSKAPIPSSN
jgi:tetratricopeptide (TPR) repeat protein